MPVDGLEHAATRSGGKILPRMQSSGTPLTRGDVLERIILEAIFACTGPTARNRKNVPLCPLISRRPFADGVKGPRSTLLSSLEPLSPSGNTQLSPIVG